MATVTVRRRVECKSELLPLWTVLTDTEYINRISGLSQLTLLPRRASDAARYSVVTRAGGFNVEWDESPYEWEYCKSFYVRRRVRKGPVSTLDSGFTFEALPEGGVRVTLTLEMFPKLALMAPIVRLSAERSLDAMARSVREIDASLVAGKRPPRQVARVHAEALERAVAALRRAAPSEIVDQLVALVTDERDHLVARIRPYEWADAWGVDRRALLGVCLNAVRAGLLELRWEIICPSCRVASDRLPTLSALRSHGECHLCDISFGLDTDEAVEATFQPTSAVRKIDVGQYCVGGPARTPHVVAQAVLPANGSADLQAPTEPGRFRLFVRGGHTTEIEVVPNGPAHLEIAEGDGVRQALCPGGTVRVRSHSQEDKHCKLEQTRFSALAATARDVTSLPAFRRDFSSEVLRPDVSIRVARTTIFFSDLHASTQLYSEIGDAAALRLVQDHFEVLVHTIEAHGGSLVKTIGDAVMAVFVHEGEALQACLEILSAFERFRTTHAHGERTHVKLGIYSGTAYLVNANGVLDYFGQAVNIAARLQGLAGAGELVAEADLLGAAVAQGKLDASTVTATFSATLKGVDRPIPVSRVRIGQTMSADTVSQTSMAEGSYTSAPKA